MKRKKLLLLMSFLLSTIVAVAQDLHVSGTIQDTRGEALIGATVMMKGTTKGTVTDVDGRYSIDVPRGSTLVISYVGAQPKEVTVTRTQLDVVIDVGNQVLDEVVVTALGIKREEKALGYSVQKLSSDMVQKVGGIDVTTSLTGKVSGMLVSNSTEFAAAPTITLRGETPLIVIDGVPYANMTMRDIAAEDIETISVLKGASASALYGYRGASGAVMITTKKGREGKGGVQVSLNSSTMLSAGFVAIPEKQSQYGRGKNNVYDMNSDQSWGAPLDGTVRNQWDPIAKEYREYPYTAVGKDNFRNFLQQGVITNNTLSLDYHTKNASLRSSVNWTYNRGQYPNSTFNKYGYTLSGDIQLGKFTFSSNMAYHKQSSPNIGFNGYTNYDPMYTLLIWTAADYDIRDYKGNYWMVPGVSQNFTYKSTHNNPYYDRNQRVRSSDRDIFNASVALGYELTDWLKVTLRSGLDFYLDRQQIKVAQGSYVSTGNTGVAGGATWIGQKTGAFATGRQSGYSMNTDLMLNATKTFGDFSVEALFGGTVYYTQDENIYGNTVGGISVPQFFSLKASVEKANVGSTIQKMQVNSLYGRIGGSWRRLIYADATFRNDWSSTLPSTDNAYFYPSLAGSFVISELLPEPSKDWLDLWKVRSSWTVSKTPPAIYATNTNYTVTNAAWGTLSSAAMPLKLTVGEVNPASSSTWEMGTQAIFFKNRLSVDITYYRKLMYDALVSGSLSSASGFTGNYVNSDEEIVRRGWEVTISGTPVRTSEWRWDVAVNWSKYARYYHKIDPVYSSDNPWVKKGERVDVFLVKDYARDPDGNQIYSNGRVQFNPFLSVYGHSDPDWIWGLSTLVSYKNWTLSASLDGRVGGMISSMTNSYLWTSGSHPGTLTAERAADAATPGSKNFLGQGVKVVSGSVKYDKYGTVLSDDRVYAANDVYTTYSQYAQDMHTGIAWGGNSRPADSFSGTFFKLRELSLAYTLPTHFTRHWAKSASLALVGQNLLMWAKDFKYSDPDGGTENFNDPSVRYIGLNVKVTF